MQKIQNFFCTIFGRVMCYIKYGVYSNEPFHILVGTSDVNLIYVSSERGGYKILNSDSLIENVAKSVQSR